MIVTIKVNDRYVDLHYKNGNLDLVMCEGEVNVGKIGSVRNQNP